MGAHYEKDAAAGKKLLPEDRRLLESLDKQIALEKKWAKLNYDLRPDLEREKKYKVLSTMKVIETIDDLLEKYEPYKPAFDIETKIFCFNTPVPMEVFQQFRFDSKKFALNDIIIVNPESKDKRLIWNY